VDAYTLRLNLHGLTPEEIEELKHDIMRAPASLALPSATEDAGKKIREHLCRTVDQRASHEVQGPKRYVNVGLGCLEEFAVETSPGCPEDEMEPSEFAEWWLKQGWDVNPDPAPMLLSSVRGTTPVPMPWQPGSLAGQLKSMMEEAAEHAEHCGDALVLDEIAALPLSLSGRPKWNSHSCRRGGTKKARDTAVASEALADDINRHFGWAEEAMRGGKRRQAAYAGTLPVIRRLRVSSHW